MSPILRHFVWGLIFWELVVTISTVALHIYERAPWEGEQLTLFLKAAVSGVVVVAVCSAVATRFGGPLAALLGGVLGAVLIVAGGLVCASLARGFELRPGIFIGSLMLSAPSALGGAVAGWVNRRQEGQ